jgi:ureidoglycolate dehydrogenase (NAD+)
MRGNLVRVALAGASLFVIASAAVDCPAYRSDQADKANYSDLIAKLGPLSKPDGALPIPEGWALDKDEVSTTDPNKAKIWLPFEGPKGSGLAMMFECWSSLLANNPLCAPRMAGTKRADEDLIQNVMVAAIDVAAFGSPEEFTRNVDYLVERIRGLPRSGVEPVLVPGERENAEYDRRSRQGIVLPRGTVERIAPVARRFEVLLPW